MFNAPFFAERTKKMAIDLRECLAAIDPAACTYKEWCNVGMALRHEGYRAADWEDWSRRDPARFRDGECARKWETFREEAGTVVTGGTVVDMAKKCGWRPSFRGEDTAFGWEDAQVCGGGKGAVVDSRWLEGREIDAPGSDWDPAGQLVKYLDALFQPGEYVGYVLGSSRQDGRAVPDGRGVYSRTAGELIEMLRQGKGIEDALSCDYDRECGAWIRFNPLDGKGVRNANVTAYRYALVESDELPIDKQNALIRELELPVAALVHSGGRSLHAIVRVDARDYADYRARVDFLYRACERNGLALDKQNRNPSRLSRMPGVERAGKKQFLVATGIGRKSYDEWREWYEEQDDDLPDFERLADVWDNAPDIAPAIIDGVLRQGHKMLVAGPSKAGKSFALIELCIAIAEGARWLGWQCAQGGVAYVNFELDRASCIHRFKDAYAALGIPEKRGLGNIDLWNLRGNSMQLDRLAPKLIRRAKKTHPAAIVIDPIYKALTGDENSAEQMAAFCNQFDRICAEVGCSVIYCHHHSKGAQGGKKAMDRSSGSGVFARDPDALLDLIELPLKNSNYEHLKGKAACRAIIAFLDRELPQGWRDSLGPDDFLSKAQMADFAKERLGDGQVYRMEKDVAAAERHAMHVTAWRVECTLREFEKPDDRDVYFAWPIHVADECGALKDIRPEIDVGGRAVQPRDRGESGKQRKAKEERQEIIDAYTLIAADKEPDEDGVVRVTVQDFVDASEECFGKEFKRASMYKKLRKFGDFEIESSIVTPLERNENDSK